MQKFTIHFFAFILFISYCNGQNEGAFPLRGKKVAVYFSKKNFTYDDNYLIPLSQFVKSDREIAPSDDDLKLQTLVSLGRIFTQQLKSAIQADSVFFLNENTELATLFVSKYKSETHFLPPLDNLLNGVDFILVVNPITLGSYKTSQVYAQSNRIIAEQVIKKSGRIRIDIFDPLTGYIVSIADGCYSEQDPLLPKTLFDFHSSDSPTGKFLAELFSTTITNLNEGRKSNCGEK